MRYRSPAPAPSPRGTLSLRLQIPAFPPPPIYLPTCPPVSSRAAHIEDTAFVGTLGGRKLPCPLGSNPAEPGQGGGSAPGVGGGAECREGLGGHTPPPTTPPKPPLGHSCSSPPSPTPAQPLPAPLFINHLARVPACPDCLCKASAASPDNPRAEVPGARRGSGPAEFGGALPPLPWTPLQGLLHCTRSQIGSCPL